MKKVLFIAYLYPPIANSGTQRSLKFANFLPDLGWEPIVLTIADPMPKYCEPSLLDEVRPGTRIERAPFSSSVLARRIASVMRGLVDPERLESGLGWRLRRLRQIPDECADWRPSAVRRAVEIFHNEGFDAIYASGWPWTAFLIAQEVSHKTGRPYLLDYRDLWKPTGTMAWEKQTLLQKWFGPGLERRVLRDASAIVTVTPSLVDTLRKSAGKVRVDCITNGFDQGDFVRGQTPQPSVGDGLVRIVYTGVWRPGYGLEDLYEAIRQLKVSGFTQLHKLNVVAAGFAPGHARRLGVDDVVQEPGPIPHSEAIDLMCNASLLYLSVPNGFYAKASLPGKLFEYIASGRPVLASVPPDSEVAAVLAKVGGALCVAPGNVQQLVDTLAKLCETGGHDIFTSLVPAAVAQYTRKSLTGKLATILDSMVCP